jgi:hypothetical protein
MPVHISEQMAEPVPGLVGNRHFNEGVGPAAGDSVGGAQNLVLQGGAGWSTDYPPALTGSVTSYPEVVEQIVWAAGRSEALRQVEPPSARPWWSPVADGARLLFGGT